eukprot:5824-Heterococcus_DN1.PRE.2
MTQVACNASIGSACCKRTEQCQALMPRVLCAMALVYSCAHAAVASETSTPPQPHEHHSKQCTAARACTCNKQYLAHCSV